MVLVSVLPWLMVGLASSLVQALLLRRALNRVRGLAPRDAGRRMRRGVPLRLLALVPVLLLVARSGLLACVGWTVGSLLGRWLVAWRHTGTGNRLVALGGEQG